MPAAGKIDFVLVGNLANSVDQMDCLRLDLEAKGVAVAVEEGQGNIIRDGILERTANLVVFLNDGVFTISYVQDLVRQAKERKIRLILPYEDDGRFGAKLNENGGFDFNLICKEQAPEDLQGLHADI